MRVTDKPVRVVGNVLVNGRTGTAGFDGEWGGVTFRCYLPRSIGGQVVELGVGTGAVLRVSGEYEVRRWFDAAGVRQQAPSLTVAAVVVVEPAPVADWQRLADAL